MCAGSRVLPVDVPGVEPGSVRGRASGLNARRSPTTPGKWARVPAPVPISVTQFTNIMLKYSWATRWQRAMLGVVLGPSRRPVPARSPGLPARAPAAGRRPSPAGWTGASAATKRRRRPPPTLPCHVRLQSVPLACPFICPDSAFPISLPRRAQRAAFGRAGAERPLHMIHLNVI